MNSYHAFSNTFNADSLPTFEPNKSSANTFPTISTQSTKKSRNFHSRFLYAASANNSTQALPSIYFTVWKMIVLWTMTVQLIFFTSNKSLPKSKIQTFLKLSLPKSWIFLGKSHFVKNSCSLHKSKRNP